MTCPNCQRNPRAFYWKRWHGLVLLILLLVVLGGVASYFQNDLKQFIPNSIALNPTPTRTNTRPPITVILVATRPPATATRASSAPALPTGTRANTPIPSPSVTNTVTETRTRAPQAAPVTDTVTPIPTRVQVAAPRLVSPTDGERISGGNKRVVMQFQPAQTIGALEWFRVQVDFLDRAGNSVSWCGFTKASAQEFPREFFDDSSPNVRSFLWRVSVVRSNQITPSTCEAPYDILSEPSQVWTFYWY